MTDFAHATAQSDTTPSGQATWRDVLVDVVIGGRLRAPIACDTKLEAQAQWEAGQTMPLLVTLLLAGASAVLSQIGFDGAAGSPMWIGVFGICAVSAFARVSRNYQKAFVAALVAKGLCKEEAEAAYQARYHD
jgi:hypothetical protein